SAPQSRSASSSRPQQAKNWPGFAGSTATWVVTSESVIASLRLGRTGTGLVVGGAKQRFEIGQAPTPVAALEAGEAPRDLARHLGGRHSRVVGRIAGAFVREMRARVAVVGGDQMEYQLLHFRLVRQRLELRLFEQVEQRSELVAVAGEIARPPVLAGLRAPPRGGRIADAALPVLATLAQVMTPRRDHDRAFHFR